MRYNFTNDLHTLQMSAQMYQGKHVYTSDIPEYPVIGLTERF